MRTSENFRIRVYKKNYKFRLKQVTENKTFQLFSLDFTLQTGSENEHILVVRRKSTIGTAAANKVIQVQVRL